MSLHLHKAHLCSQLNGEDDEKQSCIMCALCYCPKNMHSKPRANVKHKVTPENEAELYLEDPHS